MAIRVHTLTIIDDDSFGFTGPGGVGDASTNVLWVKVDDLPVVMDGTDITNWPDASGNGNDLTQPDNAFTPRYYSNVVNGQPAVRFEQALGRLRNPSFPNFPTDAVSTFIVNRIQMRTMVYFPILQLETTMNF